VNSTVKATYQPYSDSHTCICGEWYFKNTYLAYQLCSCFVNLWAHQYRTLPITDTTDHWRPSPVQMAIGKLPDGGQSIGAGEKVRKDVHVSPFNPQFLEALLSELKISPRAPNGYPMAAAASCALVAPHVLIADSQQVDWQC
jgi:hypothetical protein